MDTFGRKDTAVNRTRVSRRTFIKTAGAATAVAGGSRGS